MIRAQLLLALILAAPAAAEETAPIEQSDLRLRTIDYDPQRVVSLQGAPGYQLTVELSPDEQVQTVAVGDSAAWQVTANRKGNMLFVRPVSGDVPTNMTVITSVRSYSFELTPLAYATPEMPWTVRFRYPPPEREEGTSDLADPDYVSPTAIGRYQLGGDRLLRPSLIANDGRRTFVRWPRNRPFPAVYEIGERGEEILVNSRVEDDAIVIDGLPRRLSFRIDDHSAGAELILPRKARR